MAVRVLIYLCILLLFAYQAAAKVVCYNCTTTYENNTCIHMPSRKQNIECEEGCSLEILYRDEYAIGIARHCYRTSSPMMQSQISPALNAKTNKTVFTHISSKLRYSASICETDYCNGPVNASPHLHSPTLLVAPTFTILLPYILFLTGLL